MSDHAGQNGNGHAPKSDGYHQSPAIRRRRRARMEALMEAGFPIAEIDAKMFEEFGVGETTCRADRRWVRKKQVRESTHGHGLKVAHWWKRLQAALARTAGTDEKAHAAFLLMEGRALGQLDAKRPEVPVLTGAQSMSEWTRAADELARRPEDGEEVKRIEATVVEERKDEAKT